MGELDIATIALRLAVAALAGLAIGFEREQREKAAGLRTVALVSSGSSLLVLSALAVAPNEAVRMAAGVATGVGFLGAGAILREHGEVHGLTTAATVWVAAALGISAALGAFALTAIGTVLTLIVLAVLRRVDLRRVQQDVRTYEVAFTTPEWDESAAARCITAEGLTASLLQMRWSNDGVVATWRAVGRIEQHERAAAALPSYPQVASFTVTV